MIAPWRILALILVVQTVANIGPMGLPAIAPLIRDDLRLSLTQAGSFLSAYYIGPILMSLPAGRLADRWGIRWGASASGVASPTGELLRRPHAARSGVRISL